VDYFGAANVIVTSSGQNDSGMFETNLRDGRFLPFDGAAAVSTWTLSLPAQLRPFDYMTIANVILHVRYTAREAGNPLGAQATKELLIQFAAAGQSTQALMFNLRYDFPTEWSAFVNGTTGFSVTLLKDNFPYMVQSAKTISDPGFGNRPISLQLPVKMIQFAPGLVTVSIVLAGSTAKSCSISGRRHGKH
jgi:hypothetical protein